MDLTAYTRNPEASCQARVEEEADFRAVPVAWAVETAKSGAVAIAFNFAIVQKWHGEEQGWSQAYAPGWFTTNRTWIVKKGGEEGTPGHGQPGDPNEGAIANLAKCGLWDGDWYKLPSDENPSAPPAVAVLVSVGSEVYDGKTRYRADWVNPDADKPSAGRKGGFKPTGQGTLAALRSRFQGSTRAIAGGQSGAAPGGQAAPPAPPAVSPPQPPQIPGTAPPPQTGPPPAQPTQRVPPQPPGAPPATQAAPPQQSPPAAPPAPPAPPTAPSEAAPSGSDPADPIDPADCPF